MSWFKAGDRLRRTNGCPWAPEGFEATAFEDEAGDLCYRDKSGASVMICDGDWKRVVGPVHTVTRKEIVEGEYGRIRVLPLAGVSDKHVGVRFTSDDAPLASLNAAELRAAAAVLIELADALTQHVGAGE